MPKNLYNTTIAQLIPMFQSSTGVLQVTADSNYDLHLHNGNITALVENQVRIVEADIAEQHIQALFTLEQGSFNLNTLEPILHDFCIPLESLVELEKHTALPDEDSVFFSSGLAGYWPTTDTFWQASRSHFVDGVSAKQLAQHLNMSVGKARFSMHTLRKAGIISTSAAMSAPENEEPTVLPTTNFASKLFSRMAKMFA